LRPRAQTPQRLSALFGALAGRQLLVCFWLVLLPGLLFGNLSVLVPLRLAHLGSGGAAIGAVVLWTGALGCGNNILVGRISDRRGTPLPILAGLAGSAVFAAVLPWPNKAILLAVVVVLATLAVGEFF